MAIVFSGSPLFSGAAGSGESNIRRWIIENDWLEAVVALPDQLFYNTGISTYFWVVTNRKRVERNGTVALIDARGTATKMRKSLGNKRNYLTDETIEELTRVYADAPDLAGSDARVKVLPNETFGFERITVERPLRRRWVISDDALFALGESKVWAKLAVSEGWTESSAEVLAAHIGKEYATDKDLTDDVSHLLSTAVAKELAKLAAVSDPDAPIITDRKGNVLPDPDLRDFENVPLGMNVDEYLKREVHPYATDAWIDHTKTKIGYEIPLTRHFYVYTPPRPVAEIDAEIAERETRLRELLGTLA